MSLNLKLAIFMGILILPSVAVHEYVHAWTASKLGDWSSRRFGRMTLDPRPHIDKFGTLFLPGILLVIWAAGAFPPVFAYAKPQTVNTGSFRNPTRDTIWYALSGPLANLGLAVVFGLGLRALDRVGATFSLFLLAGLIVNVLLFVFNLMPIPGLDGARMLALALPFRARQLYQRADEYLPLFILVVFFLLAGPLLGIVKTLGNALCRLIVGQDCLP